MQTVGIRSLLIAAIVLVGVITLTALTSRVRGATEVGVKMDLPLEVGAWHGHKIPASPLEKKLLPTGTELEKCAYTDDAQDQLECSIVLASADDPRSIHRPELCLPTQGFIITGSEPIQIPVRGLRKPMPVMVLHTLEPLFMTDGRPMRGTDDKDVYVPAYVMYWFVGKDRITASHFQRTFWSMWDRTFLNRNCRWAYILVQGVVSDRLPEQMRPRSTGKDSAQTRDLLIDFTEKVFPSINLTTATRE